ncbi:MAG: hypothetical protein GY760_13530 [Deltaproteobacteria bacterium]|nr:hypothetical protein [Deltaproteobacteria bacterium]
MASRYGYVSRDTANRQIDWNAIGTQVSDGITKITEDRKERREDILTKSTDYAKMLIDMPMGSNTAFNEYLAQFTTQASKAALSDLNLLKSGEISEQEYYNRRANLLSGTELMISGANNFNKNYDVIQERIDNGTASAVEIKYREKMAQLLEFGNRTPFINPDTREVNTARLAPSGIMETTVEDIASASDMFRISNFQLNKFDMNSAIEDITKNIGIQDVTITPEMVRKAQSEGRPIGAVGTRVKGAFNSALMSEKDTELAKKDYVSSYLKDDSAVISILADYVPGYDVTLDPFEVDDKTVLIGRNGAYEITDEQRKAAEDYMIDRLDKALPESVDTSKVKTPVELRREELEIEALQNQVDLGDIKISDAIKRLGKDLSTFNSQLEADIKNSLGEDFNTNYANNRTAFLGFLGRDSQKAENAIDASLATLNEYGAWAGVNVEIKGSNIVFSTPLFDDNGKKLDEPIKIEIPVTNIKSGQQLQNTMQAFISNYSDPIFVDNAYTTGKFTEPKKEEEEPIPDDRTEIVLSFGTIKVPEGGDKKSYVDFNAFKREYPNAVFNDFIIYTRPDLVGEPAQ